MLSKTLLLLFLTFISIISATSAQNLFANSSFEELNICVEYHAPCAPEAWFYMRPATNPLVNARVLPKAILGRQLLLVPVLKLARPNGIRPYVYTMLTYPLVAGEQYRLSFFINTAKRKFYNLDFTFTSRDPAYRDIFYTEYAPTFSITQSNIVADMKQGWQAVEYEFTASGNEQYCLLGNMSAPMDYTLDDKMNSAGTVYYFIDDIKLVSKNNLPQCPDYEKRVQKIYAQNYRHSDFRLIDPDLVTETIKPKFITDTITVPAVFFETNSAVLKPAFKQLMDSLTIKLRQRKIAKIEIVGHTDNKGTPEKNIVLSNDRAESVKNYFINKLPQYAENIFTQGKGQEQPIADNNTDAGRTKNRRVEIILTIIEQK